jgi:hypothetical protein
MKPFWVRVGLVLSALKNQREALTVGADRDGRGATRLEVEPEQLLDEFHGALNVGERALGPGLALDLRVDRMTAVQCRWSEPPTRRSLSAASPLPNASRQQSR